MNNQFECGCERGGDCTTTTMCKLQSAMDLARTRCDCTVDLIDYMDSPRNCDVLKDGQSVNAARECQRLQIILHDLIHQPFQEVDENPDEFVFRPNFIIINENFSRIPLELEMVNVGEHPGDATGDPMRDAWMKVNRNFAKIAGITDQDIAETKFNYPDER